MQFARSVITSVKVISERLCLSIAFHNDGDTLTSVLSHRQSSRRPSRIEQACAQLHMRSTLSANTSTAGVPEILAFAY